CVYTRSHRSAYSFHICPPHTCIDTLSLHDALPIFGSAPVGQPSRLRTTENAMQSENTTTRISRRITGALVLVSVPLLGLTTFATPAAAHGSVVDPATRNYGCWDRWGDDHQNPDMEEIDPMCWQAWQDNPNAMWNWNGLYRENVDGDHQGEIPD